MSDKTSGIVMLEEALAGDRALSLKRYREYVNPQLAGLLSLVGFDRTFVRARGAVVTDAEGVEYVDCLGGYGAVNLGHNHPEIVAAVDRVAQMPNILQVAVGGLVGALGQSLAAVCPGGLKKVFLCNSGAEAVEGALKLARISTGRTGLLSTAGSFHGKSFGALSVSGREKYRTPFQPLLPGTKTVPYGDLEALKTELAGGSYAAFIVEPIQGEGGIVVPPRRYLKEAARACRKAGTLFVADEIQTGMGRTGRMFACEDEGVGPDIMVLAKSLGGGVMPIGAVVATDEAWSAGYGSGDRCLLHTSTFGGNTRACAAALKTIEVLVRDDVAAEAGRKGEALLSRLREVARRSDLVVAVRGRGLMIGVEFAQPRFAKAVSHEHMASMVASILLERDRIITAYTLNNPTVIRLEPPLTISDEQLEAVGDAMERICRRYSSFYSVAGAMATRVLGRRLHRSRKVAAPA